MNFQNQDNPNLNNRNQNQFQNAPNQNQNPEFNRQNLSNQGPMNARVVAPQNADAQQNMEFAAEMNQKTPGEIQRILNSNKMNVEFGYLQDAAQMQQNNPNARNNMNNPNNMNNSNNFQR